MSLVAKAAQVMYRGSEIFKYMDKRLRLSGLDGEDIREKHGGIVSKICTHLTLLTQQFTTLLVK